MKRKRPLQWHPAFQAVLEIELEAEKTHLEFYREYNLTRKPLQIDTLILKKPRQIHLRKSIGEHFRSYNIIEYKSPDDYISVNDYFKVMSYGGLLQSGAGKEKQIAPEEITVTLIESRFPRKLAAFLKDYHNSEIRQVHPGIYEVTGCLFPMRIINIRQLSKEDYVWLSRLKRGLSLQEDVEILAEAYRGKEENPLYAAAMDLIVRANHRIYEEGQKMCDALRELFAEELEERERLGVEQGRSQGLELGRSQGLELGLEQGRSQGLELGRSQGLMIGREEGSLMQLITMVCRKLQKGKTGAQIAEELEEDEETIARICQAAEAYAPAYDVQSILKEMGRM